MRFAVAGLLCSLALMTALAWSQRDAVAACEQQQVMSYSACIVEATR